MNLKNGKRENRIKNLLAAFLIKLVSPVSIVVAASAGACLSGGISAGAAGIPSPESVMNSYTNNPYIRFYSGTQGLAWTTVHPDGCSVSQYGTYIYTDNAVYRGNEGTTVIPQDVVTRKEIQGELKPGQHYYAAPIVDSVVPVGRWVLSHRPARCIHGPFTACRDFEYYGIDGLPNTFCSEGYDSGWIAYCADCGQPLTGFVYTNDICVGSLGYLFSGNGDYAKTYPTQYVFICPISGDNLENDLHLDTHMCKCFVSYNRYTVRYNGNGAVSGSMPDSVFYYGGSDEYEGNPVKSAEALRENTFINPGYIFAGWSTSPDSGKVLENGDTRKEIEECFGNLSGCGDEANDAVITLYAVWEKCDSFLLISGGSFRDEPGAYNGAGNGECISGRNLFEKGYMYESFADPALLSHPKGYRIELDMMGGPEADPVWTDTEFAGWRFSELSGSVKDRMSDGRFTYVHSSGENGSVDEFTAVWRSIPLSLPDAVYPGYVFAGWYTDPDMSPEHFAGTAGDLFDTDRDIRLYAKFVTLSLEAFPDYMGDPSFGEMRYDGLARLVLPDITGYDLFRYYISGPDDIEWTEAVTENTTLSPGPCERHFCTGGRIQTYEVTRTGIYSFELWGGAGASFGSYAGENGEYSSCEILLNEGDEVRIYTGRSGESTQGSEVVNCSGGEGSFIEINGERVLSVSGGKGADLELNIEEEFLYSGEVYSYTVEATGDYKLEVWGAKGSPLTSTHDTSGKGGYACGNVHLEEGCILYVCVGGMNGYNGGGTPGRNAWGESGGSGGGATHIAYAEGVLKNLYDQRDSILIVAGGGGGSSGANAISGDGGGLAGGTGRSMWPQGESTASGGSQTSAGTGWGSGLGGFGYGGNGYTFTPNTQDYLYIRNGGGGGGWYGGGGGAEKGLSYGCGGGGGSGYIGGVENGTMSNGVCGGNGHALITCAVNIQGGDAYGCETDFSPGSYLYRNHVLSVHGESVYPSEDFGRDGYCIITEPAVRYHGLSEKSVYSPDKEAPDAVESAGLDLDASTGEVCVFWKMPDDPGTEYSYIARAWKASDMIGNEDVYAQTDVRTLRITTGVYGFYYLIDTQDHADADYVRINGTFIRSPWADISGTYPECCFTDWYRNARPEDLLCGGIRFTPDGSDKYVHIVSADRAGNVSGVFTMAVDGPNAFIPYPVVTEKLTVREGDNVFKPADSEDVYYVRADGKSSFYLDHSSYISGYARREYQIEKAFFYRNLSEYAEFVFPYGDTGLRGDSGLCGEGTRTAGFYISPVRECFADRNDYGRELFFTGEFVSSYEGELYIYPGAMARLEEGGGFINGSERLICSDPENDRMNGLTLIGDATAPECFVRVNGGDAEELSVCNVSNILSEYTIDRRCGSVSVEIYVTDYGSGAKEGFEIRICNNDNGMEGVYSAQGGSFSMELKMDERSSEALFENMLFNGDFVISVTSEDNVGNRGTVTSACLHELDISGRICRCLDELTGPLTSEEGDRIIKRGESGYVISDVWGYPDAVLVSFESDRLSCFDTLYVVEGKEVCLPAQITANRVTVSCPEYMLEERTDFTVPLDYDSDVIKVIITAYKNDESITWETECLLGSEGTVLDELITVLR